MSERQPHAFARFEVLTFDCYGTLIDWETGILAGLRRVLGAHSAALSDDELLEAFARAEAPLETGPWRPYRRVLAGVAETIAQAFGRQLDERAANQFADSVADWPAFADAAESLRRLARRFDLGVITNCDDDLFAASNRKLGQPFRWIVTAEQVGAYKPARRNFELALERIGRPADRVLHVAQSLYHDHVPARELGLATAWIDRRAGRPGAGATPPATVAPDMTFPDLAAFARQAVGA